MKYDIAVCSHADWPARNMRLRARLQHALTLSPEARAQAEAQARKEFEHWARKAYREMARREAERNTDPTPTQQLF